MVSGPQALSIGAGALLVGALDYRVLFALIGVATLLAGGYLWHGRTLSPPPPVRIPAPRRPAEGSAAVGPAAASQEVVGTTPPGPAR